jgi:hypothetical protein
MDPFAKIINSILHNVLILGQLSRREVRLLKWCSCKGGLIDASKPIHMIYQEQKVEMLPL